MPSQTEIETAKKQLQNIEQRAEATAEIAAALEVLCERDAWHELRTLNGNGRVSASGYFNAREAMAKDALRLNQRGNNVYFTLNAVFPELSARSMNHVVEWPKHATPDDQIVSRRWLIVDVDPKRVSGIAASNEEHDAALARAQQIRQYLMQERNWPCPITMDSGNGSYLLWRVVLANDDTSRDLLSAVLQALAQRFNDDRVTVDPGMFNASRIARIPGTLNRKGDNVEQRPHRKAQLLDIPPELIPVSREQLEQVASEFTASSDSPAQPPASATPELLEALQALEQRGITAKEPTPSKDRLKFVLSRCLFNPAHSGTSVAILEYSSGAKQYSCLHDECKGRKWKWGDVLRELQLNKPKEQAKSAGQPSRVVIPQLPDVREIAGEKIEHVVPGLLVKGTITLFSGPPGSGKTTLALWLGDAIARGGRILGGACEQHPVLYATKEMPLQGAADIARRFRIDNGPNTNLFMWGPWNQQSPPAPAAASILQWVSQCESSPVLIFDPMVAFLPEGSSENDSVEVRRFFEQARTLLQCGAAGVIFLHHTGKADTAQNYRGSSDIEAAVDAAYKITNTGDCELEQLILKLFKPRFIDQTRELVLIYEEDDGVASFRSDERSAAAAITISQHLTNLLKNNPGCTVKEFVDAAMAKKISTQRAARNYLADGVKAGRIVVVDGSHNRKFHTLAAASSLFMPDVPDDEGGTVQ